MWGTCSTDESLNFLIRAAFPAIFHCYNASEMLSIIDGKRSSCSVHTPIRSKWKGNDHSDTVAPSHYSGDTHHHASPWQHIKPYVLYEEGLQREKWAKYLTLTEILCTHKGLHIPAQKQLLIIKAFCLCVLCCFDKERGTIHHCEWRETPWIFTVLCFSIFRYSQRCWIFGFETVVICALWFMILWAWKTNLSCMCKYFTVKKNVAAL